jgi:hypothetical protein
MKGFISLTISHHMFTPTQGATGLIFATLRSMMEATTIITTENTDLDFHIQNKNLYKTEQKKS